MLSHGLPCGEQSGSTRIRNIHSQSFIYYNFVFRFGTGYTIIIRAKLNLVNNVQDFITANFNEAVLKVGKCDIFFENDFFFRIKLVFDLFEKIEQNSMTEKVAILTKNSGEPISFILFTPMNISV